MIDGQPTFELVLQAGSQPSGAVQAGLLAYELLGAALGVAIAYIAYRGYRRNDSRPSCSSRWALPSRLASRSCWGSGTSSSR